MKNFLNYYFYYSLIFTSGGINFKVPALIDSLTFPLEVPEIPKSIN